GGALEWSEQHHTEFKLEKTVLICLSREYILSEDNPRKTVPAPHPAITIHNHIIQPSKSHKFLSLIVDKNLNYKEHAAYTLTKDTKYTMACTRMIQPAKGIHGKLMKRLFEGVIIPKMLYTTEMWCSGLVAKSRSNQRGGRGARGFTSQMTRVQHMATLLITRGLRSSATNMLNAHTNILPFQQILWKACFRVTLRMATLPSIHPLAKDIQTAQNTICSHC
ncbi:hypothetical protein F4604DRAFT_1526333, partial [Suillus subluteus]